MEREAALARPPPPLVGAGLSRIRTGIVASAVTILFATAIAVAYGTLESRREVLADAEADSLVLARSVEQLASRVLERTGARLQGIRDALEAAGGLDSLPLERIHQIIAQNAADASTRNVFVIDRSGRVRASFGEIPAFVASLGDRLYFARHRLSRDRAPFASEALLSRVSGQLRLPVSIRIDGPRGAFDGVIVTTLDVEFIAAQFQSLGVRDGARMTILTPEGEPLLRSPAGAPVDSGDGPVQELDAPLHGAEGAAEMRSPYEGEWRIGAYRRLSNAPAYVLVTLGSDRVLSTWRRDALRRLLGAGAVLVVASMFTLIMLRLVSEERSNARDLDTFRRAIDLSGELIYCFDPQGNVTYLNQAAARRLGPAPGQRLHVRHVSAEQSHERWTELWSRLRRDGEIVTLSEHRASDGTSYPVHVSATLVTSERGQTAFVIARDLSEERRRESEIRELAASLEARVQERTAELAEANAQLESFAHSVSHDLRAPLNHLRAYAQDLVEALADEAERKRLAAKIVERTDYMSELVDAILTLSRVSSVAVHETSVDLSRLAAEIDAEIRRLEPGRAVETRIEPGLHVRGDEMLLRLLLENLLGNAWKYTSRREHARVELSSRVQEGMRVFIVRDNGAGFDPRHAGRLFEPFQRLHSQREFPGTGVGLATARRIVSRHGGRIWAESAPGEGAAFYFSLGR